MFHSTRLSHWQHYAINSTPDPYSYSKHASTIKFGVHHTTVTITLPQPRSIIRTTTTTLWAAGILLSAATSGLAGGVDRSGHLGQSSILNRVMIQELSSLVTLLPPIWAFFSFMAFRAMTATLVRALPLLQCME